MARALALASGDPFDPRFHSGSSRQLVLALEAEGALEGAADVDASAPVVSWSLATATVLHRSTGAGRLLARWSEAEMRARSDRGRAALDAHPAATSALLLDTDFFPARAGDEPRVPVGAVLDATFAQLARSGEHAFGRLTAREAGQRVERQRRVLDRCAWLFPRTAWCAASLVYDYGLPAERMVVTGAGSNLDEPPPPREHHDGRTVLFVGRDWARKNGELALHAFALARAERPELRLIVVGPPRQGPELTGVEWFGPLDGDDRKKLVDLYAGASLLIAPSRFEPFGIALVEAMASGLPVIALDRGAAREIVVDGVTGTLLRDPEPRALADAMLRWLGDPAALRRAGVAAVERQRFEFTWRLAAKRIAGALDAPRAIREPEAVGTASTA